MRTSTCQPGLLAALALPLAFGWPTGALACAARRAKRDSCFPRLPEDRSAKAMAANFDAFCEEVGHLSRWLQDQCKTLSSKGFDDVRSTQKESILNCIEEHPGMTGLQATALQRSLEIGPWTEADRLDFAQACSTAMASKKPKRRANQVVETFQNFLTAKDTQVLADPGETLQCKAEAVTCRKVRLLLRSEGSWRAICQAAQAAGAQLADGDERLRFVREMKSKLRSKTRLFERQVDDDVAAPRRPACWRRLCLPSVNSLLCWNFSALSWSTLNWVAGCVSTFSGAVCTL